MGLSPALQHIFPLTFSLLSKSEGRALQSEFENSWDFERLHFFPMLVRQKKISLQISEVVDFEFLKYWLRKQDAGVKLQGHHLYVNPTAQILLLTAGATALNRKPGVYVLWKKNDEVCDRQLSQEEAEFLDRLQDDRLTYRQDLNDSELRLLTALIGDRIVFENDLKLLSVVPSGSS